MYGFLVVTIFTLDFTYQYIFNPYYHFEMCGNTETSLFVHCHQLENYSSICYETIMQLLP